MQYRKDLQYKPSANGKGLGTFKVVYTLKPESIPEAIQALIASGLSPSDANLEVKKCLAKGVAHLIPGIPLLQQLQ